MSKKIIVIEKYREYQIQDSSDKCTFIHLFHDVVNGWGIKTHQDNKEFVFKGYFNKDDIQVAKKVIRLLSKAIELIEEKI